MAGSCGIKCVLVLLTSLFFLCGGGLLAVGVYLNWFDDSWKEYLHIVDNDGVTAAGGDDVIDEQFVQYFLYVAIGVGGFVVLTSLIGFLGICMEKATFLNIYSVFLVLMLLGEVAIAVLTVLYREQITSQLKTQMEAQAQNYVQNNSDSVLSNAWDLMQTELKCCGANDYQDYWKNPTFGGSVPKSCCKLQEDSDDYVNVTQCLASAKNETMVDQSMYLNTKGCYDALFGWVDSRLWVFIAGGATVAALQLMGVILACCLKSRLHK